jgi:hypothetical protein
LTRRAGSIRAEQWAVNAYLVVDGHRTHVNLVCCFTRADPRDELHDGDGFV